MSVRCANGHLLGAVETCSSCLASREPSEPVDLTPSEVALARVLAAWEAWWTLPTADACGPVGAAMFDVGYALGKSGKGGLKLVHRNGSVNEDGAALLVRARKAGVL